MHGGRTAPGQTAMAETAQPGIGRARRPAAAATGHAAPPRRLGRVAFAALAAAVTVGVAACADMPSAGPVQSTAAPQGGSGSNCCALVMSGPRPGWSPTEIVSGFLLASASFAHSNAIAREYLTPAASRSWSPGSAVTIVGEAPTVIAQPRRIGPASAVTVVASGQVVATVSSSGQYKPVTGNGQTAQQQIFTVQRYGGQWRIASLPGGGRVSHELLLPQGLFNLVYKPQNLYFFAHGSGRRVLVPDPVFVPSDSSDPATRLVSALLGGVPSWLEGAAVSAFPAHARLTGVQVLPGPPVSKTAIVSLSMPPPEATQAVLRDLDAQLVWTLTSRSYGDPLVQAVKLRVNGHFWPASGSAVLSQSSYRGLVPGPPSHASLYYVGANGQVMVLGQASRGAGTPGTPVPGPAGQGRLPLSTIAVSPDHKFLAGVGPSADKVYVSNLAAANQRAKPAAAAPQAQLRGSAFTSLSWDSADSLWVAGRVGGISGVWVLPHGQGTPTGVGLPPQAGTVTALKVAPDGTRIAMIIGRGLTADLVIGAIVRLGGQYTIAHTLPAGPNLPGPSTVAWYDADHLLAVSGAGEATQLWEVPVNGDGAIRQGAAQPGITSVAAAGPQNALYLGLASGQLERSAGFGEFWSELAAGRAASYPG